MRFFFLRNHLSDVLVPETDDTFTERIIAQVIKNLQVKIRNIHIRYEDQYTNRTQPFVAGITVNALNFEVPVFCMTNVPKINLDLFLLTFIFLDNRRKMEFDDPQGRQGDQAVVQAGFVE